MNRTNSSSFTPLLMLAAIVLATAFLFPGDASFVNDEPRLLLQASDLNHQPGRFIGISLPFTVARLGLTGTRNAAYGPLPAWFYQLLLVITHDPLVMVRIFALLFSGSIAFALVWLARSLRLSFWFAAFSMLSPWLWQYSRTLWDNNFCIPLSALALAAYADFLLRRRSRALALCAICVAALTLVHLMSLALIGGIGLHILFFQRRALAQNRRLLLLVGLVWALFFASYLKAMFDTHPVPVSGEVPPSSFGWLLPLLGGQLLTAFDWLARSTSRMPIAFRVCQTLTLIANLAVWLGMGIAVFRSSHSQRRAAMKAADHLALGCVLVAGCQALLDGSAQLAFMPHYFNATWIAYVVLAWYALDATRRCSSSWRIAVNIYVTAYLVPLLIALIWGIQFIHRNAGTRAADYGTALAEQVDAARKIAQFSPDSTVDFNFPQWSHYPWAERILVELSPAGENPRPLRRLVVRYQDPTGNDARITVDESPASY